MKSEDAAAADCRNEGVGWAISFDEATPAEEYIVHARKVTIRDENGSMIFSKTSSAIITSSTATILRISA